MSKKEKYLSIDMLRCIAISLLLMAHLHDYINVPFLAKYHMFLANACLSIFALMSGFLLPTFAEGAKLEIYSFIDKRVKRIYILYLPVLVLFLVMFNHEQKDIMLLFQHVFSLQLLTAEIREPYWTLWYIGFIVPLIFTHGFLSFISGKIVGDSNAGSVLSITIMYFLLYILIAMFGRDLGIDSRISQYLPAFILGWMLNKYNKFRSIIVMFSIILLVKLFQSASVSNSLVGALKSLLRSEFIIIFPYLMLEVTGKLAGKLVLNNNVKKTIEYISFSSFVVYLIHRPILEWVRCLIDLTNIDNTLQVLIVMFSIVLIFPISFFIQKESNRLI